MARPTGTRERIQAVARELFVAQGVQHTSLKQISDRLGITKAALYYHFTSRDELVRSIIEPFLDDLEGFVAAREPRGRRHRSADPGNLLGDYFDLIWQHRDLLLMVLHAPATLVELNLMDRMWNWRERLTTLLLGTRPPAAARIRATVALGGLSDCAVEHADLPPDEVRAAALAAALAALGDPEP